MLSHFPPGLSGNEEGGECVRKAKEGLRLCTTFVVQNQFGKHMYLIVPGKRRKSFYGYCPQLSNCGQLALLTV